MTPLETKRITDKIYAINDSMVNVYLIKSEDGYIMIDAGNNIDVIKKELSVLNIDERDVIAIFLTHSDYDHVTSIPLFENAKVYLSKQEEQMINGDRSRFIFQENKIDCDNYILFDDNQTISFSEVSVLSLLSPDHTPGTTCYLINDRYLFTGDALSLVDGKVNKFMKLATMDQETHKESINKLSALENIEYIFTAHHGVSDNFGLAFSEWSDK